MITKRPAGERGQTKLDWLDGRHTFSFNRYYDPRYTGFSDLLVINEDVVAPAKGFGTHSHRDMEIITYVIAGELQHRDSMGNSSVIRPGEVQRMSAGTGVSHSEFNPSPERPTHLLQIWITPEREGISPDYEQREFSEEERRGHLRLIASRSGSDGSVMIHQDAAVYSALLEAGEELTFSIRRGRHVWIQVVRGAVTVNGETLATSDGAAISDEEQIRIIAREPSEILLFDLR
jgi:quercetin 2,3-dioxygenase